MMRRIALLFAACFLCSLSGAVLHAEEGGKTAGKSWKDYFHGRGKAKNSSEAKGEEGANPEGMVDLIDEPTASVVDYGGYRLNFRLYSRGGVQNHLSFGVFQRLNIGAAWDLEKAIGNESLTTNTPTLYAKFRVYDGSALLPSFAIGYDGQGRFFNQATDEYKERERGLYGVLSRELFFPGLQFHGGANIAKFKEGIVLGSIGASYTIEQKVAILAEYDNLRLAPENRFNAGIRFFPIPSLGIDFAVRHITNKDDRERIVRINYVGSF